MNYQKQLEELILQNENSRKKLLLHSCCAPCSSYVLEYLREYFDITVFFYNPNISSSIEYEKRMQEEIRLIEAYNEQVRNGNFENMNSTRKAGLIQIIEAEYEPSKFYEAVKGYEDLGEGSIRCRKCFELRLGESAKVAKNRGFDYFTTTLSISPHKDAHALNTIGKELYDEYGVEYLYSDFKKKNGYKRSCELSRIYNLYRQDYCGCIYSKMERRNSNEY